MIRHAGLVARRSDGFWRGALIEGDSGAGKSDLALRALNHGFRLVADDRVEVWTDAGRLFGRSPDPLQGLIEARGLGVLAVPAVAFCQIALVVRSGMPERTPDPATETILGVAVPLLVLNLLESSAPAKLGRAMQAFDAAHKRGI